MDYLTYEIENASSLYTPTLEKFPYRYKKEFLPRIIAWGENAELSRFPEVEKIVLWFKGLKQVLYVIDEAIDAGINLDINEVTGIYKSIELLQKILDASPHLPLHVLDKLEGRLNAEKDRLTNTQQCPIYNMPR